MPPEQVVLMSTGSQGEPLSALARMANREHHQITIARGRHRRPASSLVPGNENAVYRVINGLARLGATVVHKGNARVHVSGHAPAGELLYVLTWPSRATSCRCTASGGTCARTRELAEETGMPATACVLAEDGVVVDLVDGKAAIVGQRADRVRLRRRAQRRRRGRGVAEGPADPRRRGLRRAHRRHRAVAPARSCADPHLSHPRILRRPRRLRRRPAARRGEPPRALQDDEVDPHRLSQVIRRTVGKWVSDTYRRRPMIIPTVLEV